MPFPGEYDPEAEREAYLEQIDEDPGPDEEDEGHTFKRGCRKCGERISRCGCELNGPEDLDGPIDGVGFMDPGGESALRAATCWNPRDRPCRSCHAPNRLTRIDVQKGYQCDDCARAVELGIDRDWVCGGAAKGCLICKENAEDEETNDGS